MVGLTISVLLYRCCLAATVWYISNSAGQAHREVEDVVNVGDKLRVESPTSTSRAKISLISCRRGQHRPAATDAATVTS